MALPIGAGFVGGVCVEGRPPREDVVDVMYEPIVGLWGLRTFRISADLRLIPVAQATADWADGTHTAVCRSLTSRVLRRPRHEAPVPDCTCGIYATRSLQFLRRQYSTAADVVAVVSMGGKTIEGEYGWRAATAEVVAIAIRPGLLTPAETVELIGHLPAGVKVYQDAEQMVQLYPGLGVDEPTGAYRPVRAWLCTPLATVLAPLVVVGLVAVLAGIPLLGYLARSPDVPAVSAVVAVLAVGYLAAVLLRRPRPGRRALISPGVIAVATVVLTLVWLVATVRSLLVDDNWGQVLGVVVLAWIPVLAFQGWSRTEVGVTRNPSRTRTRTRIRRDHDQREATSAWVISDPSAASSRSSRSGTPCHCQRLDHHPCRSDVLGD